MRRQAGVLSTLVLTGRRAFTWSRTNDFYRLPTIRPGTPPAIVCLLSSPLLMNSLRIPRWPHQTTDLLTPLQGTLTRTRGLSCHTLAYLPGRQPGPILHPVPAPLIQPIVLRLRGGVELPDALATALEFIERDGTYQAYDLAAVKL